MARIFSSMMPSGALPARSTVRSAHRYVTVLPDNGPASPQRSVKFVNRTVSTEFMTSLRLRSETKQPSNSEPVLDLIQNEGPRSIRNVWTDFTLDSRDPDASPWCAVVPFVRRLRLP